jgi:hypothetical protein
MIDNEMAVLSVSVQSNSILASANPGLRLNAIVVKVGGTLSIGAVVVMMLPEMLCVSLNALLVPFCFRAPLCENTFPSAKTSPKRLSLRS